MIIYNSVITPDGTILNSRHVHDYITYTDKNGKEYMADGGVSYLRCSNNGDERFFSVDSEDPFEIVRKYLYRWNRYSRNYVPLCNISDGWLQNIIDWFKMYKMTDNRIFWLFIEEKLYRSEEEIYVEESDNYTLDYEQ